MKINLAIDCTPDSISNTLVALHSFLNKNPWFEGKVYILSPDVSQLSKKNRSDLSAIYQNYELVDCSDFFKLTAQSSLDSNTIQRILSLCSLIVPDQRVLYISSQCLIMKNLSDLLIPDSIVTAIDSSNEIDTSIFYRSTDSSNNQLTPELISSLVYIENSMLELISRIAEPTTSTIVASNSSEFSDKIWMKKKTVLNYVHVIKYDTLRRNIQSSSKINQLWLQSNNLIQQILKKPSFRNGQTIIKHANTQSFHFPSSTKSDPLPYSNESNLNFSKIFLDRKIKLGIITGIWKRPEIFEMYAKGVTTLIDRFKEELEIYSIIAGSEGKSSKDLVEKYDFTYIEIPNMPLSTKMNSTAMKAKEFNVDYVLCLGSDDIISVELLAEYLTYMKRGIDYIGVTDFYFYDTVSQKSAYWGGYREKYRIGHTCGAGRVLSARLLNLWGWNIWDKKHDKVLDTSMQNRLNSTPHSSHIFSLKQKNLYGLDIKSSTNMTPFNLWDNTKFIDSSIILNKFKYIGL